MPQACVSCAFLVQSMDSGGYCACRDNYSKWPIERWQAKHVHDLTVCDNYKKEPSSC